MKKYTVQLQCYARVVLVNVLTKDTTEVFLHPGAYPEAHCAHYIADGYHITQMDMLTHEGYLNARLRSVCDSINDTCKEREKLRDEFRCHKIDLDTYMTALTITTELVTCDLKRIHRLMNRLHSHDYDCNVEEAIQLYDMVF